MNFVLDASVTMLWLVPETNVAGVDYARSVLKKLKTSQALVPPLWSLEVANVITKVESKGIVTEVDTQRFLSIIGRLNIVADHAMVTHALSDTLNLARRFKLSAYDAAYLELALRAGLPLATLDADLAKAAKITGLPNMDTH